MKRLGVLLLALLLLSACATVPPAPEPVREFAAHAKRVEALAGWALRGRAALTTPQDSGTLAVDWRQVGEAYRIELRAPLGAGSVRLSGDQAGVLLQTSDGEEAFARTPGGLLQAYTGYQLPVEALRYWLLGVPVPDYAADQRFGDEGLLDELEQLGWQIDYRGYGQYGELALPTKIFLRNEDGIDVRVVVQRWELN